MKNRLKLREERRRRRTPDPIREALQLQEAQLSHNQICDALRAVLRVERVVGEPYVWRWIEDVYDDSVVYREERDDDATKLYQAPYTIDANGNAKVGTPVEVREEITYVPVASEKNLSESGSPTPITETVIELRERALREDGTMFIKIIGPGKGSSGRYSREVLERDIPKVFPKGTHMYADHPTATEEAERPERSIQDLAAVFVDDPVYLVDGPEGEGSYVSVKPFPDHVGAVEAKASSIGVSINGNGNATFGKDGVPDITAITEGHSVDFVTKAGAGGAIVSLKEAARAAKTAGTTLQENQVTEAEAQQLREAARANEERAKEAERLLQEARLAPQITAFVTAELSGIEMPEATRSKLTESLAKAPVLKDGAIDQDGYRKAITEAVKSELEFAQKAYGFGTGEITGAGGTAAKTAVPVLEGVRAARAGLGLA
jgi:hypothetical protein